MDYWFRKPFLYWFEGIFVARPWSLVLGQDVLGDCLGKSLENCFAIGELEVHRAETWAHCAHYIQWHYKQGTLPVAKTTTQLELAPDAIKVGDKRFYKVCLDDFTGAHCLQ
jgi:hypothetical protein